MFQSTHPHGVRPGRSPGRSPGRAVSIHAPTRGATKPLPTKWFFNGSFNPRTHTGCDVHEISNQGRGKGFNPRTHTGCDVCCAVICTTARTFQSTHPHGVRLSVAVSARDRVAVSIHAPTRGATLTSLACCMYRLVSIHAPTRGATKNSVKHPPRYESFNPRTHTGCDVPRGCVWPLPNPFQSTHPHGVRPSHLQLLYATRCFNPRTHTGCDINKQATLLRGLLFQSTHPHGVRHVGSQKNPSTFYVSIHAPTRGATHVTEAAASRTPVSIHAPTRGATGEMEQEARQMQVSIHAPTRGATFALSNIKIFLYVSIHAPTRGATVYSANV